MKDTIRNRGNSSKHQNQTLLHNFLGWMVYGSGIASCIMAKTKRIKLIKICMLEPKAVKSFNRKINRFGSDMSVFA
jgi:hypothetical protein